MVELKWDDRTLTAYLKGEIDHHHAGELRRCIDEAIARAMPEVLCLDFGKVSFMDSSGIGLIMGRYRMMQELGGIVTVQNAGKTLSKMMRLAGLERLVRLK